MATPIITNYVEAAESVLAHKGIRYDVEHGADWTALVATLAGMDRVRGIRIFSRDIESDLRVALCDAAGYPQGEEVALTNPSAALLEAVISTVWGDLLDRVDHAGAYRA